MDKLELKRKFQKITKEISLDIIRTPQKYKEAGQWLNKYKDEDFCKKKMMLWCKDNMKNIFFSDGTIPYCSLAKKVYGIPYESSNFTKFVQSMCFIDFRSFVSYPDVIKTTMCMVTEIKEDDNITRDYLYSLIKNWLPYLPAAKTSPLIDSPQQIMLACNYLLDINNKCCLLKKQDALKICLLTWILYDPDADEVKVNLTDYEKWNWYTEAADCIQKGRMEAFTLLESYEIFSQWQELATNAWEMIKDLESNTGIKDEPIPSDLIDLAKATSLFVESRGTIKRYIEGNKIISYRKAPKLKHEISESEANKVLHKRH